MSDSLELRIPESNVEEIVRRLVLKTAHLDGSGLVQVLGVLLARAEEHQRILAHSARTSEAMLAGSEAITQEAVNAQLLDTIYQTRCLKLFLARACRKLAEEIDFDLRERQSRFPRIRSVVYSAEGEVESFQLEKE